MTRARYEVRCTGRGGVDHVVGETDDPTGGSLMEVVERHPVWTLPRVVLRGSGQTQLPAYWPFPVIKDAPKRRRGAYKKGG